MRHKEELFREIINASLEFIKLTSDKVRELEGETEKLKITPLLKIILKERLKELESEKCFTITQCPETLKAICPASLETKDCFETENTFCHYHSDGNCKNCFVFYLKNKRRVR